MPVRRVLRCSLLVFATAALVPATALAAPTVTNIAPRGLQIGEPTTIVVTGSDLPADAQVVTTAAIARQTVKPGAKPNRVEIEVVLDAGTAPGLYAVRVTGATGVSGPLVVGVDRLPQAAFAAAIHQLPVALHGQVGGAQVLTTRLQGKQGQRLVLDVEAQRLGSGLKPVVRLNDPRGTQLAWSPPRTALGGDARLEAVLPADGQYTIELHDELFRPAGPGYFRLKVGDLHYADLAFPLAITADREQQLTFARSSLAPATQVTAVAGHIPGEMAAPPPAERLFTGATPRVVISEQPELVENRLAANQPQELPALPLGISGVLSAPGEEDTYVLSVEPRQKLKVEVLAREFGSLLDGVLSLRDEQGQQLASGDDRPGTSDPMVEYTVPAKTKRLVVAIKDLLGRGGREFIYRLAVASAGQPDFSLALDSDRVNVPAGAAQVLPVQVTRSNYDGPIELALDPQPGPLRLEGNVIPAGATIGLVTISADETSPGALVARLVGRAVDARPEVLRTAQVGDFPGGRYQPRLRSELGLAVTVAVPFRIAWLPGENDRLFLGGKLPARLQFTRTSGAEGKIRVRLVSSHPMPKKTIRQGMQQRIVDDPDRTLRLEGEPAFGPDQTEATVNILVPSDLPKQPWDVVLIGELLTKDGKSVVSSLATPVRKLEPIAPFSLVLTGPEKAEGKAGGGSAGKLTGKIARSPGYKQPVLVTLDKLPQGYFPPQVLVPGDRNEFELPLSFGNASPPGELKGVEVVALAAPATPKSVRSNAVAVAIEVTPGEKRPTEPPKVIFEDEEKFAEMLVEGTGRAIPDQRDKYSGTYSLRVTPDQKSNPQLAGLTVKIREHPGPGEYRYLRFAWRKLQGNSICLQLAHDGKFGPGGGREGATFRYHAGPGEECFDGSLLVSDKVPARFEVVTRDLFLDFGEFTLTGIGFAPVDGQAALFDHIYLARHPDDFDQLAPGKAE